MIITRNVEVVIKITLEIDTDLLEDSVTGGAEGDDAVEEAISYSVQEMDYSMNITEPGIKVLKTNLESYS